LTYDLNIKCDAIEVVKLHVHAKLGLYQAKCSGSCVTYCVGGEIKTWRRCWEQYWRRFRGHYAMFNETMTMSCGRHTQCTLERPGQRATFCEWARQRTVDESLQALLTSDAWSRMEEMRTLLFAPGDWAVSWVKKVGDAKGIAIFR